MKQFYRRKFVVSISIILALSLIYLTLLTSCENRQYNDKQHENPLQNIDLISLTHKTEDGFSRKTTITDHDVIMDIVYLYHSIDLSQDEGGQPMSANRYVIVFFSNDVEIATWWVGENSLTASTLFDVSGNKLINDTDFRHNFFERFFYYTQLESVDFPEHGYLAMDWIRHINDYLYGRVPFTYRELEAAEWIVEELLAMGYATEQIKWQSFSSIYRLSQSWERLSGTFLFHAADLRDYLYSQNIILTVPGQSNQIIVVGAHYDSYPYPGASDNASGVAILLESAYRMRYIDNYYTIKYVFFGAEEVGLLGAYYFLESLTDIQRDSLLFMINADSLFEGSYPMYAAGVIDGEPVQTQLGYTGANEITRRWDEIANELYYETHIYILAYPDGINTFLNSDHLVFYRNGHTVMFLMGMHRHEWGLGRRILHSYRDCYHYVTAAWPEKMETAMRSYSIFLESEPYSI